jgi:hypothetical protein
MRSKKNKPLQTKKGGRVGRRADKAAVIWWANWVNTHSKQIEAYNKDVTENGVWSDGLRTF